ncbi:XRE family transcriptional regulator [Halobacteriovorax sp. DA5]|uniref:XRE family transcriptional regulator n=1 Tax=Halobacteriovorax sp. DA5 TaxID=2067553 RepID=UPI000CD059E1|nr:XRE family transcriptional regulator [Halobacteriovorax sp. DA5]POB13634.1 hypothetical protein C0Z22_10745 [Halobacteriovorax sp. DA5]
MTYKNEDVLKRIHDSKRSELTHITGKSSLSIEERVKVSLCKHFVRFANEKKMKPKDLSDLTGISASLISEITNYKIKKFSIDILLKSLTILGAHSPRIWEYLVFIEKAVEVPALKATEARKLIKIIRK